jgi:hypothetical protein
MLPVGSPPPGNILKAVGSGTGRRFGAQAVRFSGPNEKDLHEITSRLKRILILGKATDPQYCFITETFSEMALKRLPISLYPRRK